MPEKTARRATLTVTSEGRGHYQYAIAGDLDGMEWAWILLSALDRVRTQRPSQLETGHAIEGILERRRLP